MYCTCTVLLCLVCLILLASFFLPSYLSFKKHVHVQCVWLLLQRTGDPAAHLTQEEIQAGIDKANEQRLEAIECEHIHTHV